MWQCAEMPHARNKSRGPRPRSRRLSPEGTEAHLRMGINCRIGARAGWGSPPYGNGGRFWRMRAQTRVFGPRRGGGGRVGGESVENALSCAGHALRMRYFWEAMKEAKFRAHVPDMNWVASGSRQEISNCHFCAASRR